MLRARIMNVVNETTHESAEALALITLGPTACSTLYRPPLALLTILMRAAHVTAIRKRICTSARDRRGSRHGVQNFYVVLFVNLLALGKVLDMSSSIEWNCRDKEKQSLFSITTPN